MTNLTMGLMRRLTETPGGPGDEGLVRDVIARAIHRHVDDLRIDNMGNLIALKRGTGASPLRVAVTAHMDEIVFFINEIDSSGFLHVLLSGGVNARTVLAKVVQVGPERLPGVICLRPPHMSHSEKDFETVPEIEDLLIDIGARDEAAAKAKVKLGQRAVFSTDFDFLGPKQNLPDETPLPQSGRVKGKAFDNRMGCAALIDILAGARLPFDLYGVFNVQEEIGLRGAFAAGGHLQPDVVFVLEGTVCDDLPGADGEDTFPTARLGNGPAITQRDRSYVVHAPVLQHLLKTAQRHGIPSQFKHPNVGGTDAAGYAFWRGIPVGIISTPCRYIHGPVAVAELSDLHNGIALVGAALADIALAPTITAHPQEKLK